MGTRLIRGRWFAPADTSASQLVAVVNETLARQYFRDGNAVGGRIRLGGARNPWVVVVGIVADERHNGVTGLVKEKFYIPHSQWHLATGGTLVRNAFVVVRTAGDPRRWPDRARRGARDRSHGARGERAADARSRGGGAGHAAADRLPAGTFAAIALVLAAVGIYGVLAYLVARRTHEIGIRLAIGADRAQVVRMVLAQGLTLTALGLAAGLAGAVALSRLMAAVLYDVAPTDPLTFAVVIPGLLGVAAAASLVPALRAARVSPLVALRSE